MAHLNEQRSGKPAARAALQFAQTFRDELERMPSGDEAIGFLESRVYEATGKRLVWQYIQLPM